MTARTIGLWSASTNLFRRGQAATVNVDSVVGAGGGSITLSSDTSTPGPFSPASYKVQCDGLAANQGISAYSSTGLAATTGTPDSASCWFKGVAGQSYTVQLFWVNTDASSTAGTATTFTAAGVFQLLSPGGVTVAAGKTGDQVLMRVRINGTRAETFWLANVMLSETAVCPPYVPTSGATASAPFGRRWQTQALRDTQRRWAGTYGRRAA